MPINVLQDENLAAGVPGGPNAPYQSGVSNRDSGQPIEQGLTLPALGDPATSWLFYNCTIDCYLDSGMALHKPLPQNAVAPDTLGIVDISEIAAYADTKTGVNTRARALVADVVQRMATSTYRFVLRGEAARVGYRIPCPKLVKVAGVAAFPDERQFYRPVLLGNFSGVPLYYAEWELWYMVALPVKEEVMPPANLAQHLNAESELPPSIQLPYSGADFNAVASAPPPPRQFFIQGPGG